MSNIGIALQLYGLRDHAARNLGETLTAVKSAGFDYVQWAGMPDLAADSVRDALDSAGLKAVAAHCPAEWFEENLDGAVAYWERVGAPDVAASGMFFEDRSDLAHWREGCARLAAVGASLRERGLRFGYHHHGYELTRAAGDERSLLTILLETVPEEHLAIELDTGWLASAGEDPASWFRHCAGRCPVVQLSDLQPGGSRPVFAAPGAGTLDWADIFDAGEEAAVEWYVCSFPVPDTDPEEALKRAYAYLAEHA